MSPVRTTSCHTCSIEELIATSRLLLICMLVYHYLLELPDATPSPRNALSGVDHVIPEFINAFFHMAAMAAVPPLTILAGFVHSHAYPGLPRSAGVPARFGILNRGRRARRDQNDDRLQLAGPDTHGGYP